MTSTFFIPLFCINLKTSSNQAAPSNKKQREGITLAEKQGGATEDSTNQAVPIRGHCQKPECFQLPVPLPVSR
jgi:hypothetical protein